MNWLVILPEPEQNRTMQRYSNPSPCSGLLQILSQPQQPCISFLLQANSHQDRYLRSVADYRNLQDRTTRESSNARLFAIQKFATDLLDSIDNLDRALSAVPKEALAPPSGEPNPDLKSLHGGLRMSEEIMMQTLKKHGIERFDPLEREGNKFDPNLDEATFFTKVEGKNDGEVFYTQSKGYTLNGRVIRASKVGVVKNA